MGESSSTGTGTACPGSSQRSSEEGKKEGGGAAPASQKFTDTMEELAYPTLVEK